MLVGSQCVVTGDGAVGKVGAYTCEIPRLDRALNS